MAPQTDRMTVNGSPVTAMYAPGAAAKHTSGIKPEQNHAASTETVAVGSDTSSSLFSTTCNVLHKSWVKVKALEQQQQSGTTAPVLASTRPLPRSQSHESTARAAHDRWQRAALCPSSVANAYEDDERDWASTYGPWVRANMAGDDTATFSYKTFNTHAHGSHRILRQGRDGVQGNTYSLFGDLGCTLVGIQKVLVLQRAQSW